MNRTKRPRRDTAPNAFAESIKERVAMLVPVPPFDALADWLDAHHDGIGATPDDYMTREQARALGWLEGAAEALDMTVLEFVDANT